MRDIHISGGGADVVAWLALAVSIFALIVGWYWSWRNERRSYRDNYWFREVVAPCCIEPIRSFRETWCTNVLAAVGKALSQDDLQILISKAQDDLNKIRSGLWVARIFQGDFHSEISKITDVIEDAIAVGLTHGIVSNRSLTQDEAVIVVDEITSNCLVILQKAANFHSGSLEVGVIKESDGWDYVRRLRGRGGHK